MGLFDLFKKKKQNDGDENAQVAAYAQKMCCGAVEYAKSFGKNFDFSENSITDLEEILDFYSNDISVSKPTENQIWSMAVIFGSYLGQTILKNGLSQKGYYWAKEGYSNIPLLICKDGGRLTPVDKVYKRLVNGCEDNVVSFYRFAISEL